MFDLSKKKLKSGENIFDFLIKKLQNQNFNFIDVGARNGSFLLPEKYTKHTTLYGFEPNKREYEKLLKMHTDAFKSNIIEPTFKKKKIYDCALSSSKCKKKIFITNGPGASSLMGKVNQEMVSNLSRHFDKGQNYYEKVHKTNLIETIECDKIDNLWKKKKDFIDFLKIDAEGSELDILNGALKTLKRKKILMIKSEFLMIPYYKKHVLLGHQQVFLDKLGYRLVNIQKDHFTYSWKPTKIKDDYDEKFLLAGDAYYIIDPDLNKLNSEQKFRLGLICLALQFNSSGINFIRESNYLSKDALNEIELIACKPKFVRWLTIIWKKIPSLVANFLRFKNVN